MRIFIAALVLIFSLQSWTKADDIRDFEIEGISIGDSLLDYFDEENIKKSIRKDYFNTINDNTFVIASIRDFSFNTYEGVQFVFKRKDKKYKIYGMHGIIFFKKNISDCNTKLKEISHDISSNVKFEQRDDFKDLNLGGDSGKYTGTTFFLKKGIISIHCYDWSKKIEYEKNWSDNLRVNIKTDEYEDFLQKEEN